MYYLSLIVLGKSKATAAIDAARSRTTALTSQRKDEDTAAAGRPEYISKSASIIEKATTERTEKQQNKIDKNGIFTTPTPTLGEESTWLEKAVAEVLISCNNKCPIFIHDQFQVELEFMVGFWGGRKTRLKSLWSFLVIQSFSHVESRNGHLYSTASFWFLPAAKPIIIFIVIETSPQCPQNGVPRWPWPPLHVTLFSQKNRQG